MQKQKNIPSLQKGDQIRIVAPASAVEKAYIKNTVSSLRSLGYEVSLGEHLMAEYHQFAGTDERRCSDFQKALDDPEVKAIFCARGGYGTVRIIDRLNFDVFIQQPKWVVGFSDITILHSHINGNLDLPTVHAPMPVNFDSPHFQSNLMQLNSILTGQKPKVKLEPNSLNQEGEVTARLLGGNLSILYSLQATPYEINLKDSILFIEDVEEQLYHLDRMLNNFRLSGKLQQLKGLIVGGFTAMKDKKRPFGKNVQEIISAYVADLDIPVVFDFPAGHTDNNVPFLLGGQEHLQVGAKGAILTV